MPKVKVELHQNLALVLPIEHIKSIVMNNILNCSPDLPFKFNSPSWICSARNSEGENRASASNVVAYGHHVSTTLPSSRKLRNNLSFLLIC